MRKIEKEMLQAIREKKNFSKDNTRVVFNGLGNYICNVYLHGNLILSLDRKSFEISLAGWNTPTTRSRLNALSNLKNNSFKVFQKKGLPYLALNDSIIEIDENKFYNII